MGINTLKYVGMVNSSATYLGRVLKQQRVLIHLTLAELSARIGISASHLGRIERGQRLPSVHILQRLAKPLGLSKEELFIHAGFISSESPSEGENSESYSFHRGLDPNIARLLAQEPMEVQRAVIGILSILKSLAKSIGE